MSDPIARIEARLSAEAAAYCNRRKYSDNPAHLDWALTVLSGLSGPGADFRHGAIARLERLLQAEARRGRARHPAYSLNRHLALREALDAIRDEARADDLKPHATIRSRRR